MSHTAILLTLLIINLLSLSSTNANGWCGTPSVSQYERVKLENSFHLGSMKRRSYNRSIEIINVYFHVVMNTSGVGNVSDESIQKQMEVLNAGFANHFKFDLKKVHSQT